MARLNGVYVDDIFAKHIPKIRHLVLKQDRDKVLLFDGREGSGKSVLAMQIAKALDPDFNLDKVAFNHEQFISLLKSPDRKKGDFILLDEAFSSASSRASLSYINKAMITVATEMRQLNLFVGIVLPTFFDLDRYFAIWRCETLFHVYFDKEGRRGQYVIFPFNKKKKLYLLGKKNYNYFAVKSPYPACRFTKEYVVNEIEYRSRKAKAFKTRTLSSNDIKWKSRSLIYLLYLSKVCNVPYEVSGKLTKMSGKTIKKHLELAKKDNDFNKLLRESGILEVVKA